MIFVNRILVWLSAIAVLSTLEFLLNVGQAYELYLVIAILNAIVIATVWQFTGRQLRKGTFWNFAITPLAVVNSGWIFLTFLEDAWPKQLVVIIMTVAVWVFLKVTFLYFFFRPKYQAHALENISSYLNLIAIFLFNSDLFNLMILLDVPVWQAVIASLLLVGALSYQLFWVSDIGPWTAWRFIAVIILVTGELFLTVSFLPTSVYVNGLLISLGYYIMGGLARNWLLNIRESHVARRYLLISFSVLVIILLTAKWF